MKFCHGLIGAPTNHWCRIAQICEDAGFDSVAVSDHAVYPSKLDSKYPYTDDGIPLFDPAEDWPDAWVAIGAMAAVTTRLRFTTNVYVLPARNPFVAAKAIGTAAVLSGNRVDVGIGAGWMREEFELLEQPFARRGARMEEMVQVMRLLWTGEVVEFHGEFYDFDPVMMRPAPSEPVPILVGGHSDLAFERAARFGDGWFGMHYGLDELLELCAKLRRAREDAGTADRPFEIVASPLVSLGGGVLEQLEEAGVTTILTSTWFTEGLTAPDLDRTEELIRAYGERFIA